MSKQTIGTIIESRPDGSYIYMSHRGILNLDDWKELQEAEAEDGRVSLAYGVRGERPSSNLI